MWVLMDAWPGRTARCHLFFLLIRQSYTCQIALRRDWRRGLASDQSEVNGSVPVAAVHSIPLSTPTNSAPPRASVPPSVASWSRPKDLNISVIL